MDSEEKGKAPVYDGEANDPMDKRCRVANTAVRSNSQRVSCQWMHSL